MTKRVTCAAALAAITISCRPATPPSLDQIAEGYVRVALQLAQHNPDLVDDWRGPDAWKPGPRLPVAEVLARIDALQVDCRADSSSPVLDESTYRAGHLDHQLRALRVLADRLNGASTSIDEELGNSKVVIDGSGAGAARQALEAILPGDGTLATRHTAYRRRLAVTAAKIEPVMRAALDACRDASTEMRLPPDERVDLVFGHGSKWDGFARYLGDHRTRIEINLDGSLDVTRALRLACHEGYPGHHVANVLFEEHGVNERGWVELSVAPLQSPLALILEGSANYGIPLAFSDEDRLRFERDTLFPLAGIDPALAPRYAEVRNLQKELRFASNEAARRRIDRGQTVDEVVRFLTELGGATPARARQSVRFIDANRSYVINYNLGERLIADHVARAGGGTDAGRWQAYIDLLLWPRPPSAL